MELKKAVANAVLAKVPLHGVIGVGTGSTVEAWIAGLAHRKADIEAAVASSERTAKQLKAMGIPVVDLNGVDVNIYIDGADEVNDRLQMIKGGGGALTREKIVATSAKRFVLMVDYSKRVKRLGVDFPLPIEVIPMARGLVARACIKLGGQPVYRKDVITDNGHVILDVHHLNLDEPLTMAQRLNQIPGVVCHGLFASITPDVMFCANKDGAIETIEAEN